MFLTNFYVNRLPIRLFHSLAIVVYLIFQVDLFMGFAVVAAIAPSMSSDVYDKGCDDGSR